MLLGPTHGDVERVLFLDELLGSLGVRRGDLTLDDTENPDRLPFETFGGMDGADADPADGRLVRLTGPPGQLPVTFRRRQERHLLTHQHDQRVECFEPGPGGTDTFGRVYRVPAAVTCRRLERRHCRR